MANIVYRILEEYNLMERLHCITSDNASNNYALTRELSNKLRRDAGIEWNHETHHLPCLAHVINLLVKKLLSAIKKKTPTRGARTVDDAESESDDDMDLDLDDIPEADGTAFRVLLATIGRLATSLRRSTTRWKIFQAACKSYDIEPMTIPFAMDVRFTSHYRQLFVAIYLRRPLRRYVDDANFRPQEKHLYELSDEQWDLAEFLLLFLMPFQRCTERFECNESRTEIDYVFFAYDTLYNHLDDVEEKLKSGTGIGALSCAPFMLTTMEKMKETLSKYYSRTEIQTVYVDAMILNPRTKLVIAEEESWSDVNVDEYRIASRRRFIEEYDNKRLMETASNSSHAPAPKRPRTSLGNDSAYRTALLNRSSKHRRNDFDRYIEIPNDPDIVDSLSWWRENQTNYPTLAKMARDTLSVPASGCTVERVFSISGRIAIWQRNRLNADTISQTMLYKYAMAKANNPLFMDDSSKNGDVDIYPVPEKEGNIPEEWIQYWWCTKLDKVPVGNMSVERMFPLSEEEEEEEEEEDLYG
jgi:hypothetical protein